MSHTSADHNIVAVSTPWQRPAWHTQAACRGMNPDWWFPERGQDARRGRAVCATCPVRLLCQEQAVTGSETHGFWGGLSSRQLRQLRTQRRTS